MHLTSMDMIARILNLIKNPRKIINYCKKINNKRMNWKSKNKKKKKNKN